jgi:hypothetical protein
MNSSISFNIVYGNTVKSSNASKGSTDSSSLTVEGTCEVHRLGGDPSTQGMDNLILKGSNNRVILLSEDGPSNVVMTG